MSDYKYDFTLPTQFLKYRIDGRDTVINKNNIISIREIDRHNGEKGDYVEILIDKKGTSPSALVFKGKIENLNKYFEPFYL